MAQFPSSADRFLFRSHHLTFPCRQSLRPQIKPTPKTNWVLQALPRKNSLEKATVSLTVFFAQLSFFVIPSFF